MQSTMLTYNQAASHLGLPIGTLYAWVSSRRIPHVRFGKRAVRFDRAELDAWVDRHRVCADPPATPRLAPAAARR